VDVPTATPEALVALKLRASSKKPERRSKDYPDIVALAQLHRLDLSVLAPLLTPEELEAFERITFGRKA